MSAAKAAEALKDITDKLKDPNAVYLALLRGDIAKPSFDQIIHVYQREFNERADALSKATRINAYQLCAEVAKREFQASEWHPYMRQAALTVASHIERMVKAEENRA